MIYFLLLLIALLIVFCAFLFLRSDFMNPNKPEQRPHRPEALPVKVFVGKNQQGEPALVVEPAVLALKNNQQARWTCPDGRLEIRFSPGFTPFTGSTFETSRGGFSYSGTPISGRSPGNSFKYTVLVTTADGLFLTQNAEVVVGEER